MIPVGKMKIRSPETIWFALFNYVFQSGNHFYDSQQFIPGSPPVLAYTNSGMIIGTQHYSRGNIPFNYFRGIPYARPPIGKRRFEPPEPHPGWNETLNAKWYGSECIQVNMFTDEQHRSGNEDCLFLNIATRKVFDNGDPPSTGFRPVIFWIHGGFFMQGSANFFAPNYFMDEDVVFVTFNYRLNSFGFLNTGDGTIAGNMGMKDQVMALQWVNDNIKYFNGDPDRITLMGESAGAVSAHLHTITEPSKNLFKNAISFSGTALSPWAFVANPEDQFAQLAMHLGCNYGNTTRIVRCMKRMPANNFSSFHTSVLNRRVEGESTFFGPTIEVNTVHNENTFLADHPINILESGNFSYKPWINGVNSGDGAIALVPIIHNGTLNRLVNRYWHHYAPIFMGYRDHQDEHKISAEARKYYLRGRPLDRNSIVEAIEMMSDRAFFLDSHMSALLHSKVAPTYSFEYIYEGILSFSALVFQKTDIPFVSSRVNQVVGGIETWFLANALNQRRNKKYGVCHGEELPILFPWLFLRKDVSGWDQDFEFSKKMIKLLVSFAETGVPDPSKAGENVSWPSINETNPLLLDVPLKRMLLNSTFTVADERFYERMQFWIKYNIHY